MGSYSIALGGCRKTTLSISRTIFSLQVPPELPNSALQLSELDLMKTKKTWEFHSSVPTPAVRPSHCLRVKISNASQPTPSDIIYQCIIHPRRRFSCITPVLGFKFAKFEKSQTGNVRKRPFPSASPYKRPCGLRIPSMSVRPTISYDRIERLQSYTFFPN